MNRTDNLDLGLKQANLNHHGKVALELIQLNGSISTGDLKVVFPERRYIDGFFKIGFGVEDFDSLLAFLELREVDGANSVVNDPVTGQRMVVVKDPDGNRVQFFER